MSVAKLEPLSKKEMKTALAKPFRETKRKLMQGFGNAQIFYYVLRTTQFSPKDKEIIAKGLANCFNPRDCHVLVAKQPGWSYREISLVNDYECGALLYKGLAVAVYFKRQVDKIEPEPMDPVPSGALENLDDVWARLDLFTKSPRQLVDAVHTTLQDAQQRIVDLEQQLKAAEALYLDAHKKLTAIAKASTVSCTTKVSNKSKSKGKKTNGKGK